MTISKSRFVLCAAFLLAACATGRAQSAVLMPMGSVSTARIDPKVLPPGAEFEVGLDSDMQEFVLRARGVQDLLVIPLGFGVQSPQRGYYECGVYFSAPNGTNAYVPVAGHELYSDSCDDIPAVGLMHDPGPRPRLIVIATPYNLRGTFYRQPFILSWNTTAKQYEVDQKQSKWLANQPHADSIANVRKLLAQR